MPLIHGPLEAEPSVGRLRRRPPMPLRPVLRRTAGPRTTVPALSHVAKWLLAADAAGLVAAVAAAVLFGGVPVAMAATYAVVAIASLVATRAYSNRIDLGALDSALSGVRATIIAAMGLVTVLTIVHPTEGWRSEALTLAAGGLVLVPSFRAVAARRMRVARIRGRSVVPVVVVGAGEVGARIVQRLSEHPQYGMRPTGFVDVDPYPLASTDGSLPPFLGGPTALDEALATTGARHVILAFSRMPDESLLQIVRHCEKRGVEVSVVPRFFDAMHERVTVDFVGGIPLIRVPPFEARRWPFLVKHAIDRVVALMLLALLAPLLAVLAIAVKLTSPGPVLFHQRRVGRDGTQFALLKFRTMRAPAPEQEQFTLQNGCAPGGVEGIDRRTTLGKFLRRTSLDELPQFINVLRGDMSLVGPRPERPEFVALFDREVRRYAERHRVKAGITGWAQVNNLRGQTSIAKRAEWDNFYIQNFSLLLDLKILLLTLTVMFRAPNGER